MKTSFGVSKGQERTGLGLRTFLSGILISYLITLPIFAIFAVIMCFVEFPISLISPVVIITTIISLLAAGYLSSRGLKQKGWLNGALTGLVYIIALYLIGSIILSDFTINRYVVTTAVMAVVAGAIGGMAGVNCGGKTHKKRTVGKYMQKLLRR